MQHENVMRSIKLDRSGGGTFDMCILCYAANTVYTFGDIILFIKSLCSKLRNRELMTILLHS